MKNAAKYLLFAASLSLGTAAYGQTILRADVPFAFRVPGGVAPAGEYRVQVRNSAAGSTVEFTNLATQHSTISLAYDRSNGQNTGASRAPRMVFRCGHGICDLAEVWSGSRGLSVPVAKPGREREFLTEVALKASAGAGN